MESVICCRIVHFLNFKKEACKGAVFLEPVFDNDILTCCQNDLEE